MGAGGGGTRLLRLTGGCRGFFFLFSFFLFFNSDIRLIEMDVDMPVID